MLDAQNGNSPGYAARLQRERHYGQEEKRPFGAVVSPQWLTVVLLLASQLGGMLWYSAQMSQRVYDLEKQVARFEVIVANLTDEISALKAAIGQQRKP